MASTVRWGDRHTEWCPLDYVLTHTCCQNLSCSRSLIDDTSDTLTVFTVDDWWFNNVWPLMWGTQPVRTGWGDFGNVLVDFNRTPIREVIDITLDFRDKCTDDYDDFRVEALRHKALADHIQRNGPDRSRRAYRSSSALHKEFEAQAIKAQSGIVKRAYRRWLDGKRCYRYHLHLCQLLCCYNPDEIGEHAFSNGSV